MSFPSGATSCSDVSCKVTFEYLILGVLVAASYFIGVRIVCRQHENNFIDYRKHFYAVSAWTRIFRPYFVLVVMLSLVLFVPSAAFSARYAGLQPHIHSPFFCPYLLSSKGSPFQTVCIPFRSVCRTQNLYQILFWYLGNNGLEKYEIDV